MRISLLSLLLASALTVPAAGGAPASTPRTPTHDPVWQAQLPSFENPDYEREVEALIKAFETATGKKLVPGAKKKAGLKIYTDSGAGMATPVALVQAVIVALERRGFEQHNIFLVGLNQLRLRMSGYLPSFVTGETPFKGHPIFVLESGKFYDPVWFYDSPLPQRFDPIFAEQQTKDYPNSSTKDEDRKSFLATPLFLDADFWINLPVYTDHPVLGINGALVNATLWNASNTFRFFKSPATAPAAVAEMAAIPELREGWALNIASLQLYQFIGGPYFNSLYTVSEPRLLMSADPVILDSIMLERLNAARKRTGFDPITTDDSRMLDFAQQLGVGSTDTTHVQWRQVDGGKP